MDTLLDMLLVTNEVSDLYKKPEMIFLGPDDNTYSKLLNNIYLIICINYLIFIITQIMLIVLVYMQNKEDINTGELSLLVKVIY